MNKLSFYREGSGIGTFKRYLDEVSKVHEIMNTLKKNWKGTVVPPLQPTEKSWSLPDLFIRQYLNNMTDGFNMKNVKKMYIYLLSNKDTLIEHGMISKEGYNNSGFPLWKDYDFKWRYGIDNNPPKEWVKLKKKLEKKPERRQQVNAPSFHEDTILHNVVCNHCKNTLPPHSIKRHLDKDDKIHKCPHN